MTTPDHLDLTTLQDRALHDLLFGKMSRSGVQIGSSGRWLEAAASLLCSDEFQVKVAEPALEGTLDGVDDRIEPDVQAWAERALALPHLPDEPRLSLLARVLESSALAPLLERLPVAWSAGSLADALRAGLHAPAEFWTAPASAAAAVARVARGVQVQHVSGLSIGARPQEQRLEAGERWLMFKPSFGGVAAAEFCRVEFGLISENERPDTVLHVDYGDGFCATQVLPLEARGRSRYAAFLAEPGRVKALRWDLAKVGALCRLTMLSACEVGRAEIARRAMAVAGEPGLDWLAGRRLPNLRPYAPEPEAFRLSRALTRALGGHDSEQTYTYADWLADNEPSGPLQEAQDRRDLAALSTRTPIALVLPIDDPDALAVRRTIESVRQQVYPAWTLHLAPVTPEAVAAQHLWAAHLADPRVVTHSADVEQSAAAALNAVLAETKCDWIGTVRPGQILKANALLRFADTMAADPDLRVIYADHDHLDGAGVRSNPVFKPDFAPETLLGFDYVAGVSLQRTEAVRALGGWDGTAAGAAQYDLLLRLTDGADARHVAHLAEVLAHHPETSAGGGSPAEAERQAVERRFARLGQPLRAEPLEGIPGRRIRAPIPQPRPLVSLIIPTRDRADLLSACVTSILDKTDYDACEVIVVDNGSVEDETKALFASWAGDPRIQVLGEPGPFNYARLNNAAAAIARGEILGLINNDIEVVSPDWLAELASWAAQPEIGCVGAKLLFPNDTIQHGGIVLGIGGVAAHAHKYASGTAEGFQGRLARVHNVSAVTGACLLVRRAIYQELGGLDEAFAVAYNDVDFCLRVEKAGYRNIFTPFAELYHHESLTRGTDDTPEKAARLAAEAALMQARWADRLRRDPYYSPNLTQIHENFAFNNPAPAWSWSQPLQDMAV